MDAFPLTQGFPRGAVAPPEAAGGHLYTLVQAPRSLVLGSRNKEHPLKWLPHPDFAHVSLPYFPQRPLAVSRDSRTLILGPIIPSLAALESTQKSHLPSHPTISPWSRALPFS